jgi:hypothetical protein
MFRTLLRLIVGVIGVLALLLALRIWTNPVQAAAQLGVSALGPLGVATLRADLAGFFAAAGGFALAAAIRDDRRLLSAPLAMVGLALVGRCLTVLPDGLAQPMIPPMAVEAGLVILFALGRRALGSRGA